MLRKIVAAIRSALQFVTKTVMMPVQVAGKLVMMPIQVLQRVAGAFGGGGGEAAEEAVSAAHAQAEAAEARTAAHTTEKAAQRQAKAADVRFLARARAESREIAPALWERVPAPVADYLRGLSSSECAKLASRPLREVSAHLTGEAAIPGVRRIGEAVAAPAPVAADIGTRRPKMKAAAPPEAASAFRAGIAAALGKPARAGAEPVGLKA